MGVVFNPLGSPFDFTGNGGGSSGSPGDISETVFNDNIDTPSNAPVTGLKFDNTVVRSFEAQVYVQVVGTDTTYELFMLYGVHKNSSWEMTQQITGDVSGVTFSIDTTGQVTYSKATTPGYTSTMIRFRAETLSV